MKLQENGTYICQNELGSSFIAGGAYQFKKKQFVRQDEFIFINQLGYSHGLYLEQVKEIFGEEPTLVIPVEVKQEVFNPQPHYDNTHGSLYKIAVQRGWNPYLFDIVKRLDRAGKKENNSIEQEIDKTIDVLKLWKTELYGNN